MLFINAGWFQSLQVVNASCVPVQPLDIISNEHIQLVCVCAGLIAYKVADWSAETDACMEVSCLLIPLI